DADLDAEAEAVCHLGDAIDSDQIGRVIEENVAGFADGAMHRQGAVPAFLPAMEYRIAEVEFTWAKEFGVRGDHAGFERGGRHQRLERRTRRIGAGNRLVFQWIVRIVDQCFPLHRAQAAGEGAWIETRRRSQSKHLAVPRIDDDGGGRALRIAAAHRQILQRHIETEDDLVAVDAVLVREFAHNAAKSIDLDLAGASGAAKLEIVLLLDAAFADAEIGQLYQRIVAVELLFRNRRDVTHDVRSLVPERIMADETLLDRNARQIDRVDVDTRHLVPVHILAQGDRHETVPVADVTQNAAAIRVSEWHEIGDRIERLVDVACLFRDHHGAVGRPVDGERHTEAIDDAAARRHQ